MLNLVLTCLLAALISACAYTQGTEVQASNFEQLKENKSTKADVEKMVGYPQRKQTLGANEIWYYDFTKISHNPFGGNVDESTVFEFNKKGVLIKKYKTKGSGNVNPLLRK